LNNWRLVHVMAPPCFLFSRERVLDISYLAPFIYIVLHLCRNSCCTLADASSCGNRCLFINCAHPLCPLYTALVISAAHCTLAYARSREMNASSLTLPLVHCPDHFSCTLAYARSHGVMPFHSMCSSAVPLVHCPDHFCCTLACAQSCGE